MSDIERTLLIRIKNILDGSGAADAKAEIDRLIAGTKEHEKAATSAMSRVQEGASRMGAAYRSVGAAASGSMGGLAVVLRSLLTPMGLVGVAAGAAALAVQAAFRRKTEAAEEHRQKLESISGQLKNIDQFSLEQARTAAKDLADQYERQRAALSGTYELVKMISDANTAADQKRDAALGGQSPEERKQRAMSVRDAAMERIAADRTDAITRQSLEQSQIQELTGRRDELVGGADRAQFRYLRANADAQRVGAVVGIDTLSPEQMQEQLTRLDAEAAKAERRAASATAFEYNDARRVAAKASARARAMAVLLTARLDRDRYKAKRDSEVPGIDTELSGSRARLDKAMSDRSMTDVAEKNALTDYDVAMRDAGASEEAYRDDQVKGRLHVFGRRLDREPVFRDNADARSAVMATAEAELRGNDLVKALNNMAAKLAGSAVVSKDQLVAIARVIDELDGRVGEFELRDKNNRR